MEDRFYYNWLFVNEKKDRYKDPLNITPLSTGEFKEATELTPPEPGYSSFYCNRLRDGNCRQEFTFDKDSEYAIRMISEDEVILLLQGGNRLLAGHSGTWAMYNCGSETKIKSGTWRGLGGTFCYFESNFLIFDNMLQTLDTSGELLHNTVITLPPGIGVSEIARVGDNTIVAAYVSPDQFQDRMPEELRPCGFLEVIKESAFSQPQGQLMMRDREESSTLAFVEDNVLYPIYLDESIIQPITGGIVVLDYNLIIQRVIVGEFEPLLASCGVNSAIYMAVKTNGQDKITGITLDGISVFAKDVPPAMGRLAAPPMVSSDGSVYWVGTNGFAQFSAEGEELAVVRFGNEGDADLYPALFNETLVVGFGNRIIAYDANGEELFNLGGIPGDITTALETDNNRNYFIGTSAGLFSITEK